MSRVVQNLDFKFQMINLKGSKHIHKKTIHERSKKDWAGQFGEEQHERDGVRRRESDRVLKDRYLVARLGVYAVWVVMDFTFYVQEQLKYLKLF